MPPHRAVGQISHSKYATSSAVGNHRFFGPNNSEIAVAWLDTKAYYTGYVSKNVINITEYVSKSII